ncbi:hypothetical protein DRO37_03910 [Candidatus Bathyarchaeota archaeon]|nr:MAG: hypothetical protein DRO37_03910 [Candidatus Bathyarchaeota archaeon]
MEMETDMSRYPNWKLIEIAARDLHRLSSDGTFTRKQIIDYINKTLLKGKESRNPSSLNPMIQALTANAPGGAPGGIGKNVLWRVGKGRYRLFDPDRDRPIPEKTVENRPIVAGHITDGYVIRVEPEGSIKIPSEIVRMLRLKPNSLAICRLRDGRIIIEAVPDLEDLLEEKPEVKVSIEEFLAHRRELSKRLES